MNINVLNGKNGIKNIFLELKEGFKYSFGFARFTDLNNFIF